MRLDGTLERATLEILQTAQPLTKTFDAEETAMVMLAAASILLMEQQGCTFEDSYAQLRDLAIILLDGAKLH